MPSDDVSAAIREIRERVRARYPDGAAGNVPLPNTMPLLHARDAAMAKVASIGTVNPRPGGVVNALIQNAKRLISRALAWHVRDQVEFNRGVMQCVEATLEALNECKASLNAVAAMAARSEALVAMEQRTEALERRLMAAEASTGKLEAEAGELKDIRKHWSEWRAEWERKLSINEVQFLRSVADLQGAFQHRATQMEGNFRDIANMQHRDFEGALQRSTLDIQKRLWDDMARIREEYERLIHNELRVVRQRASATAVAAAPQAAPVAAAPSEFDYLRFEDRFRGTPEYVKENQKFYVPYFQNAAGVLDIGCGRGEFLAVMKDAGIAAKGIDLSSECVALCTAAGLDAEKADLFAYLDAQPPSSLDAVFCGQVVEHIEMGRLPEFARLLASRLRKGAVVAIETPNPECLAIFATHFYLDPTHVRPVPPNLLVYLLEEAGFGSIQVERRFPAIEAAPALGELPEAVCQEFFGAQDYAVIARRL